MSSFAASGNKANKTKPPQKLYLPNLTLSSSTPDISTLKARLTEHFSNSSITITELTIKKSGTESYAATISCSISSVERARASSIFGSAICTAAERTAVRRPEPTHTRRPLVVATTSAKSRAWSVRIVVERDPGAVQW